MWGWGLRSWSVTLWHSYCATLQFAICNSATLLFATNDLRKTMCHCARMVNQQVTQCRSNRSLWHIVTSFILHHYGFHNYSLHHHRYLCYYLLLDINTVVITLLSCHDYCYDYVIITSLLQTKMSHLLRQCGSIQLLPIITRTIRVIMNLLFPIMQPVILTWQRRKFQTHVAL